MTAHHELGARLDEHGAWRRAVVRQLVLGAGIRPPCLVAGSCLQQHRERDSVLAREETTVDFPRATVVGSRLHIERKP